MGGRGAWGTLLGPEKTAENLRDMCRNVCQPLGRNFPLENGSGKVRDAVASCLGLWGFQTLQHDIVIARVYTVQRFSEAWHFAVHLLREGPQCLLSTHYFSIVSLYDFVIPDVQTPHTPTQPYTHRIHQTRLSAGNIKGCKLLVVLYLCPFH